MTDAQFRDMVQRDARACGWPADVAAALARYACRDTSQRVAPEYPRGVAPRASAPQAVSLADACRMWALPAATAAEFAAAGYATGDAAAPLLRAHMQTEARCGAATATMRLRLRLQHEAIFRKDNKQ